MYFSYLVPVIISIGLAGCASTFNTAGNGDYGCPGLPMGVVCKTPAAVYKSTHQDPAETEFDAPIGRAVGEGAAASNQSNSALPAMRSAPQYRSGPRPVREDAKVARIWIAPWVDKQDNLHLAETQYSEIKPRTWTVGKPESAGSSYVIPHLAFESIGVPRNERIETRPSDNSMPSVQPQSRRDYSGLPEAPK